MEIESNNLATANMATNTTDLLVSRLLPERFYRGDNLEEFITDCQRFFNATNTGLKMQKILVTTLLDKSLLDEYEAADGKSFEEKLRNAFQKPSSLIEDLKEALNYEQGNDSAEIFIDKIKKMTKKLMNHKWDEEEIEKCLLIHCVGDKEVKKEIEMRELKTSDQIKSTIKKVEKVNKAIGHINVVRATAVNNTSSYRDVARNGFLKNTNMKINRFDETRRIPECWTCKKSGHISRECHMKRIIQCYACGTVGHVRRECPTIQCRRCCLRGHKDTECYTNLERRQKARIFDNKDYNRHNNFRNQRYEIRDPMNRYQQSRRPNHRMIAAIDSNGEKLSGEQTDELNEVYEVTEYPKEHAPSREAMIGAVY